MAAIALLWLMLTATGCGVHPDPEISEGERVAALLESGQWKVQSVKIDNMDETSSFTGLALQFNGSAFQATNGNIVWPASGTWTFTSDAANGFTRNDGVTVSIDQVTESNLGLTFTWSTSTFEPGRISSVAGEHKFTFTK